MLTYNELFFSDGKPRFEPRPILFGWYKPKLFDYMQPHYLYTQAPRIRKHHIKLNIHIGPFPFLTWFSQFFYFIVLLKFHIFCFYDFILRIHIS